MYEHRAEPLISTRRFVGRLLRHLGYGSVLVLVSLVVGTAGFATLTPQRPIDALLSTAMLLGGMGPVGDLEHISASAKLFAAGFALYAGLVFLLVAGLLVTPVFHRVLHRFHWEGQRGSR